MNYLIEHGLDFLGIATAFTTMLFVLFAVIVVTLLGSVVVTDSAPRKYKKGAHQRHIFNK